MTRIKAKGSKWLDFFNRVYANSVIDIRGSSVKEPVGMNAVVEAHEDGTVKVRQNGDYSVVTMEVRMDGAGVIDPGRLVITNVKKTMDLVKVIGKGEDVTIHVEKDKVIVRGRSRKYTLSTVDALEVPTFIENLDDEKTKYSEQIRLFDDPPVFGPEKVFGHFSLDAGVFKGMAKEAGIVGTADIGLDISGGKIKVSINRDRGGAVSSEWTVKPEWKSKQATMAASFKKGIFMISDFLNGEIDIFLMEGDGFRILARDEHTAVHFKERDTGTG